MDGLRRGTTPNITCEIIDEVDLSNITSVWLTISQNNELVIDKLTDDVTINTKNISVRLTQEETLSLKAGVMAYIQVRLLNDNEIAYATQTDYVPIDDIIKDGVIS